MSVLFNPLNVGALTLPNRIVIPPMCQYSAKNGLANSFHTIHYGNLMLSGAGMLIIEATAVEPKGRISAQDLGLWNDETEHALTELISTLKKMSDMPIAIQLGHAGRKGSSHRPWCIDNETEQESWQPLAPSALRYSASYAQPKALSLDEIIEIKGKFIDAVKRAVRCGVDAIEIHAAHGYLLHQFLSPITNHRQDDYGGCLDNRLRLLLEIIRETKKVIPASMPLGVRISATDWLDNGWDLEQSIILTQKLKALGCQFIDVSSGGLSDDQKIVICPNYQVPFAQAIKEATGMPTITVGLIKEALQAEAIVATKQADMVAIGREMLYNPRWPWHCAEKLASKIKIAPQYWRGAPKVYVKE